MNFVAKKANVLLGLVMALALTPVIGCGYSGEDRCNEDCDCTGDCSENTRSKCISDQDAEERDAEAKGCLVQRGDYLDCHDDTLRCVNGKVDDACAAEQQAYFKCMLF